MPNIVGAIINSFSMDCVMESSLSDSSRIGMGLSKILSWGYLCRTLVIGARPQIPIAGRFGYSIFF